jgi:hypothetical protein
MAIKEYKKALLIIRSGNGKVRELAFLLFISIIHPYPVATF